MAKNNEIIRKEYDDDSICQLTDLEAVRKSPNVYLGTKDIEGVKQAAFEIISNSVDEAREGFGKEITVTYYLDRSVEVADEGRGIPLGLNKKYNKYNWELIFCKLNAGGKYDKNSGSGAYTFSLGTHGIGACATQLTSEYMTVRSYRSGVVSEMNFKAGKPRGKLEERPCAKGERKNGTVIRWLPDITVFTSIEIESEYFKDTLRHQAMINNGIRFIFREEIEKNRFETNEYFYTNGIVEYIEDLGKDSIKSDIMHWYGEDEGKDRPEDKETYKLKMEIAFCISEKVNSIEYYHNSSHLTLGGSPENAVRNAFVSVFDKYISSLGLYKKDEKKIQITDITPCIILVTNCFSSAGAFLHQTKNSISNAFIQSSMTKWLKENLESYIVEHPDDARMLSDMILVEKRSNERADVERKKIKKTLQSLSDTSVKVEKFVGCRSKDASLRELYIVEGDSALTSVKLARDADFQAVIPLRGKIMNCIKQPLDKIFESEVIVSLLRVIGCGVEINKTNKKVKDLQTFNIKSLKWNKIVICTDADEDGFQIRTLILTVFHALLPSLIRENKVFIAESPLFEITTKDRTLFAYDEREKEQIVSTLGNAKYQLQRSKGLGENEPEMMWQTTMNPASRRLLRVNQTNDEEAERMFDILLGEDYESRKEFIRKNGSKYYTYMDL